MCPPLTLERPHNLLAKRLTVPYNTTSCQGPPVSQDYIFLTKKGWTFKTGYSLSQGHGFQGWAVPRWPSSPPRSARKPRLYKSCPYSVTASMAVATWLHVFFYIKTWDNLCKIPKFFRIIYTRTCLMPPSLPLIKRLGNTIHIWTWSLLIELSHT